MKKSIKRLAALMMALAVVLVSALSPVVTAEAATAPKKLTLLSTAKTMYLKDTYTVRVKSVSPSKASKSVTFKTSNKKVATVTSKGVVTAKAAGTATITVTSKLNKKVTAKCKITVMRRPQNVYMTTKQKVMLVGEKYTAKVKSVNPKKACKRVRFRSANTKIASVGTNSGVIKAKRVGNVNIIITAKSNPKVSTKLLVKVYNRPTKLTLTTDTKTMLVGDKYTVKYKKIAPAGSYKGLKFTSSNSKVASVSSKGVITAKKSGTVKITAQSTKASWVKDTITVKVYAKPVSIELNRAERVVAVDTVFTLVAKKIAPSGSYKEVKFASSNEKVASVSQEGKVKAKRAGKATITVTSKKDKNVKATCVVTVYDNTKAKAEVGGYVTYTFDKAAKSYKAVYKTGETVSVKADDVRVDIQNMQDSFVLNKDTDKTIEELFEGEEMNELIEKFETAKIKAALDEVVEVKVTSNDDGSKNVNVKRNGSWDVTAKIYVFGNAEGETNMAIEQIGGAGRNMIIADIEKTVIDGNTVITCNADGYALKVTINENATAVSVERTVAGQNVNAFAFEETADSYVISFNKTYALEIIDQYGIPYSIDDVELFNMYAE